MLGQIHSLAAFAVGKASLVPGCRVSDGDLTCPEIVIVYTPSGVVDLIG